MRTLICTIILLGFFVISCLELSAQTQLNTDSLIQLFEKSNIDTQKVALAWKLYEEYWTDDSLQSAHYIASALSISKRLSDKKWLCFSLLRQARYYWEKGKLEKAKEILGEVQQMLPVNTEVKVEASYYQYLGMIEHDEGNYEISATYFLKALQFYEKINDEEGISQCYNNLGSVYWRLNDLDKAKEHFEKYAAFRERQGDLSALASTYGNVGLIYRAKNENEKALEYYHKSLKLFRKLDKKFNVAINLQNIGSLYHRQKKYKQARTYFEKTLEVCKEIDDKIGILYAIHSLAAVDIGQAKYRKGIDGLIQALKMAEELSVKEEIKNLNQSLAEAYLNIGQYKRALEYRDQYDIWKDSLISEKHLKRVKELELAYETEKKDKQIELLSKENEIQALEARTQKAQNNALIGGLILLGIIGLLSYYFFQQKLRSQKLIAQKDVELKETHFQRALLDSELTALRAQMNPHFIFNCLNSINRMILSGDHENSSRYLTKFSRLLRMILENAEKSTVSLEDEIYTLRSYIELESLRFKDKIKVEMEIDPDIDLASTYIPSMLLQPLLENAIWHGLMPKKQQGLISISMKAEEDYLKCKIEDNGIGREKAEELKEHSNLKSKSMGLEITRERLKLLHKQVTEQLLKVTDLKDSFNKAIGTRVEIALPIS